MNFLTGHFLVHPKTYVFFMNSYMNSWFFMNIYIYEFFARTLLGTPEFIVFQEILPDVMDIFSPETSVQVRPRWNPTYSREWVTLHDFSSAFLVSGCQAAEWLWPIANLKSLMSWNRGLLQVQNIRFIKKIVFESVQSQLPLYLPFR